MTLGPLQLGPIVYVVQNMRAADREEIFATRHGDCLDTLASDVFQHWGSVGWVAWHDHLPVAAFGATSLWPGSWMAWLFATDNFGQVGFEVTRHIRRVMIPSLVDRGASRCEARSIISHTEAHRWLRSSLGATEEARLRRYGRNGEDFLVFRWDRPEHVRQFENHNP